jgi:hypothetical protein
MVPMSHVKEKGAGNRVTDLRSRCAMQHKVSHIQSCAAGVLPQLIMPILLCDRPS